MDAAEAHLLESPQSSSIHRLALKLKLGVSLFLKEKDILMFAHTTIACLIKISLSPTLTAKAQARSTQAGCERDKEIFSSKMQRPATTQLSWL